MAAAGGCGPRPSVVVLSAPLSGPPELAPPRVRPLGNMLMPLGVVPPPIVGPLLEEPPVVVPLPVVMAPPPVVPPPTAWAPPEVVPLPVVGEVVVPEDDVPV